MASKKEESVIQKAIEHPVDTVLTKNKAEQHRRLNTALAALGTGAAVMSAARLMRQKPGENVVAASRATTQAARDISAATNESPLNRSSRAKAVRRQKKRRKAAASKYLHNKRMAKMPKWRKILNKLPGGRIKLFENPIKQRVLEKVVAKDIAFAIVRPELDDGFIDAANQARRVHNRATANVKTARKAGSAVADIRDAVKGERRHKRRKRFYEKQAFKDRAIATAITAGGLGLSYLASTKRGRNLIKNYFESKDDTIEFKHNPNHDWYTSRPTGSSVRVHTGGTRRKRRSKYWYEKKANRDKMLAGAGIAGLAGLGLGATSLVLRGKLGRQIARRKAGIAKRKAERASARVAAKKANTQIKASETKRKTATEKAKALQNQADQLRRKIDQQNEVIKSLQK